MTRPQTAILLAVERSGTHLLRSIINANAAGFALDEVANAATARPDNTIEFFGFQRLYQRSFPDRVIPNVENSFHRLHCYLDNIVMETGPHAAHPIILDIKYAHVVNFAGSWWLPFQRPALFQVAEDREVPIIHLVRRKVFQTAISGLYAEATGVWKATAEVERSELRLAIPRDRLLAHATHLREAVHLARRWLAGLNVTDMVYEDLLDRASRSWRDYESRFGAPITHVETRFVKSIASYADAIENFNEIADLLDRDIDDPWWDQPR